MIHHYYFKFGTGNEKFKEWIDKKLDIEKVPLSIYFWPGRKNKKDSFISKKPRSKRQIENFFDVEKNLKKGEEVYFWIFFEDEVFCYKPISGEVYDGGDKYTFLINEDKENQLKLLPKCMDAELMPILEKKKINLPEVFNVDSNQTYNRKTIAKLKGTQKEIADFLIEKEKDLKKIGKHNFLDYLSPIEFETLIFLIFNYKGSYCSSFRGGTLKDFDLKVSLSNFDGLPNGLQWIQVKNKDDKDIEAQEHPSNRFLIHKGESEVPNKTFGKKWLIDHIDDRKDIIYWLENITFNYPKIFNFSWNSVS